MENITVLDPVLVRELEQSEVQYWKKYYRETAPFPSYATVIADGMAFAVPSLPILAMNRVIGLGLDREISTATLDDIISFYRAAGVNRFFVQLAPQVLDDKTQVTLKTSGFRYYNNWTKHFRTVDEADYPPSNQALQIIPLPASSMDKFGTILCDCFGWNYPNLDRWLNQAVGQIGYQHYAVSLDGRIAAVAALHVEGIYASMAFAATLPAFRGLGIQQELLLRRIMDAQQLECKYLVSETAEDKPENPVTSARNMRRMGFQTAYQRQNWIFEF